MSFVSRTGRLLYNYPMRLFGLIVDISCMVLVYLSFLMPKWKRRGFESLFAGTPAGAGAGGVTLPEKLMKMYRKMPSPLKKAAKKILGAT